MTQLLYIPTSTLVTFVKAGHRHTLTTHFEESEWHKDSNIPLELAVLDICKKHRSMWLKRRNKIPKDEDICLEEFEIIKEETTYEDYAVHY